MKKITFLFCLLASFLFGENWTEYQSLNGKCKVLFPDLPDHFKEQMQLNEASKLPYDIYTVKFEGSTYLMLVAHYPLELSKEQSTKGLKAFLQGFLDHHPNSQLLGLKFEPYLLGNEAMDFFIQGKNSLFRGKAFVIVDKLYLLAVESTSTKTYKEQFFQKFIDSFALVP